MSKHVGVDGCRFGWIAVFAEREHLRYRLFRKFDSLVSAFPEASIMVDIPIGLPWAECVARPCDLQARKHLGPGRASSVFPAPSRASCKAADVVAARARNIAEVGRSLSAQAWGICAKVAEVDDLLLANTATRLRVREIHPEVCFWALNAGAPMSQSKSTKAGAAARMAILMQREPRSEALLKVVLSEHRPKDVQPDDVLDALVAFLTASATPSMQLRLQGHPACDQEGLPMEMLYVR